MPRRTYISIEDQPAIRRSQEAYDRWLQRAENVPAIDHAVVDSFWQSYIATSRDLRARGWRPQQEEDALTS
jgi:hypothetical protein